MKFARYLLPLFMATGWISANLFAQDRASKAGQETAFERQLNEVEDQPLREFVQSKENIDLKDKSTHLEISGDVRFEWRNLYEDGYVIGTARAFDSLGVQKIFVQDYRSLRGGDAVDYRGLPISHNDWDVEFNLKFKYTYGRAWAQAHLQFDNSAGIRGFNDCDQKLKVFSTDNFVFSDSGSSSFISTSFSGSDFPEFEVIRNTSETCKGSGESNSINLKRAFMGYNIYADGRSRLDIEIGRRKLDDVFDSEIEFSSRFDGVLLKYASAIDEIADWYWDIGVFVIDERVNHVGYVTEIGFLNIGDTGLDLKYSYIDWTKRGKNRCFVTDAVGSAFRNSQISFSYNFKPEVFCKTIPAEFYGGFLVNHAAKRSIFTHGKRKNLGWYTGLYVGEPEKEGDWAFDIEYVYVQAQAVSDCDVSSIGRGNILDERLTDIIYDPKGEVDGDVLVIIDERGAVKAIGPASDFFGSSFSSFGSSYLSSSSSSFSESDRVFSAILPRRGNANFKGWRCEFLYLITDNFSLDLTYEHSDAEDRRIGGDHPYTNYEIEAIYAF